MSMWYQINHPRVVHQTIDGETIIIDFESGAYFSLNEIGSLVWELIAQGLSLTQITELIIQHYSNTDSQIASALKQFITELQTETLISVCDKPFSSSFDETAINLPSTVELQTFIAPALQKYTDMQDLLLLDPIHEVDSNGWPTQKPDTSLQ